MIETINDIAIHFQVSGPERGPAVVLHHPLATNLTIWDELTAALEPRYRVVRMDARGHGKTEAPAGAYTFAQLSADVIGLMDHLEIEKARFLGLSMGGMVGQHLGLTYPNRFHSLCLCSTTSAVPEDAKPLWDQRIRAIAESGTTSTIVDGQLPRWVTPPVFTTRPDLVARLRRMIETTPAQGYAGWCHAIRDLNVTSRLKEIRLPTHIVVGAEDPATPPSASEVIHQEIAGSTLAIVPGVSHMLHVEDPAAFHAQVLPFMEAHGPHV
jgi:3-oxoadipate enol-lactonase